MKKLIAFEKLDNAKEIRKEYLITNSHPSYWKQDGVRMVFDAVYSPSRPEIEKAYAAQGKTIYRPSEDSKNETPKKSVPSTPTKAADTEVSEIAQEGTSEEISPITSEDFQSEEISLKDWREFSWPKLRSAAKDFSDEPIKSKEQAEEVMTQAENDGKL